MRFLLINGANLNMLGVREPEIYGTMTLDEINNELALYAKERGVELDFFQSNHEGEIIDRIQTSDEYDGIIINPAGYSHYSVCILDAIKAISIPVIEVHLSNITERGRKSITREACIDMIEGLGIEGYKMAIDKLADNITKKQVI